MDLAKPALDVGMYTNDINLQLTFWQQGLNVPFAELLPLGAGLQQHRHSIGESVLKINHSREPIPRGAPTGLSALTLYRADQTTAETLNDPDGNVVTLAPLENEMNLTLHLTVNDLDAQRHFYGSVLGLPRQAENVFRAGTSAIELSQGIVTPFDRTGIGYRYMTLQVYDVLAAHKQVVKAGGGEGMPPTKLGDVAHIAFVLDPDGNWIELSQRKSIVGSLD